MNIQDRVTSILETYAIAIEHAAEHEKEIISSTVHSELAKIEAMVHGLVAQLKAKLNAATKV